MKRILVVCHGNVQRSPLCAAALRKVLHSSSFVVKSAGVKPGKIGTPAAKKVRDFAETQGLSLVGHAAQSVTPALLEWADVVLYMDRSNLQRLRVVLHRVPYEQHPKMINMGRYIRELRIADPAFRSKASSEFAQIMRKVVRASTLAAEELLRF